MFVRIKKMPMKILAQNKKKLSVSIKIELKIPAKGIPNIFRRKKLELDLRI